MYVFHGAVTVVVLACDSDCFLSIFFDTTVTRYIAVTAQYETGAQRVWGGVRGARCGVFGVCRRRAGARTIILFSPFVSILTMVALLT